MKGFSPALPNEKHKEVASKIQKAFIELGAVNSEHDDDCECDECLTEDK